MKLKDYLQEEQQLNEFAELDQLAKLLVDLSGLLGPTPVELAVALTTILSGSSLLALKKAMKRVKVKKDGK